MGSICCSCLSVHRTNPIRVVIYGLENSGKTSLINGLKNTGNQFNQWLPISTHGVVSINVQMDHHEKIHLLVFDCGGCKHQRHIWPHLSNDPDLLIFAVDSTDVHCFKYAKEALFDLLTEESLEEKPVLIAFTKSDQTLPLNIQQLKKKFDLRSITVSNVLIIDNRAMFICLIMTISIEQLIVFSSHRFHTMVMKHFRIGSLDLIDQ
jgi:GTPase SAR1 family protein